MKCPKCKHVIPDDSLFCPDCGCKIDNKEERIKELKHTASQALYVGDFGKSFGAYQEAANLGDADAQYILAMQYENGQGTIQDGKACHKWLLKAAQNGHVEAQFLIAQQYYYGNPIQMDKKAAAVWYQKAANAKHPDATFKLGLCYKNGEGVEHDDVLAQRYFEKAKELGSEMYAYYFEEQKEEERKRKEREDEENAKKEQELLMERVNYIKKELGLGSVALFFFLFFSVISVIIAGGGGLYLGGYYDLGSIMCLIVIVLIFLGCELIICLFFSLVEYITYGLRKKKWIRNHSDDPVCKYL